MSFFGKYYFCNSQSLVGEGNRVVRQLLSPQSKGEDGMEAWTPAADIYDAEDGVVVLLELAGVRAADIQLTVSGEWLTIRGLRRSDGSRPKVGYRQMEITTGPFERTLQLPGKVDPKKACAQFHDGILEVYLPHAPQGNPPPLLVKIQWRG